MDQVEEIKQKLNVVELVGGYVKLKQAGRNFKGLCPFHQEKTPSFMVNPELGIYKCFGCGKGGDAFNFIEEIEGLEFGEALEMLAERAGVKLLPRLNQEQKTELDQMREALELALQYFHYLLTQHSVGQVAREYLKSRRLSQKLVDKFSLGFALDSWDGLKKYLVEKKKFKPELLERAGLLVRSAKGGYYDRFRARIIFPLRDHRGKTIGFAGRVVPQLADEKEAKYINSPETPLYHKSQVLYGLDVAKQSIRQQDRVILVEGEMDMISSYAAGVGETVAVKGTAFTEDQVKLLGRYTRNLFLALDADTAGDEATKRSIILAEAAGMNLRVIRISGGKDPDDIARNDSAAWKKLIDTAVDVYDFYLSSATKKHDPQTVEGKRRISTEVLPIIGRIANQVFRGHYVKKIAAVLGVDEADIEAEIGRLSRGQVFESAKTRPTTETPDRLETLGREMISLLWATDDENNTLVKKHLAGLTLTKAVGQIIRKWLKLDHTKENRGDEVINFIKSLPAELRTLAGEIYLESVDLTRIDRDLETTAAELEKYIVKQKLDSLTVAIKSAEKDKAKQELKKLQHQFVQWSSRIQT